ncbi:hypothetical protein J6590_032998 [Homalodisca vitripennis]|nr:hypothetical protein J6590_032998 [Homalodisca vitripennis]
MYEVERLKRPVLAVRTGKCESLWQINTSGQILSGVVVYACVHLGLSPLQAAGRKRSIEDDTGVPDKRSPQQSSYDNALPEGPG